MRFRENLNDALVLKKSGKTASEIVDWLFFRKVHHIEASILIMTLFDLDRESADKLVYSHTFYKKFKDEMSPFTQDFLDEYEKKKFFTGNSEEDND